MVAMGEPQGDLFLAPRFDTIGDLLAEGGKPSTFLIGCGQAKLKTASPARRLYVSDRFQNACAIAETLGADYFILSGLHRLLNPDQIVEPYDVDVRSFDEYQMCEWSKSVVADLAKIENARKFCILSTSSYSRYITETIWSRKGKPQVAVPLEGIDPRYHDDWHQQALAASKRVADLKRLYELIEDARIQGNTFLLSELSKRSLPNRGVYLFLDASETNFFGRSPRIVRIGTHAVSEGSKSTLRNRLRNHLGLANGSGSHRGSVFRLHVGRALLEKENAYAHLESWGSGQDAPPHIRKKEYKHEIRVSDYLSKLEVYVIELEDEPNKNSIRASVERQLIALLTQDLELIDRPSSNWLGRFSPKKPISGSGLWNVRDVGSKYCAESRGSVEEILSLAK